MRWLLAAAFLGLLSPAGQAAVAIDATGTAALSGTGVTSFSPATTNSPNVGAGLSNGAIVFAVQFDTNVSGITAKWGSQTLTRIGTGIIVTAGATTLRAELFGGIAPTSGQQQIALTWTTSAQCEVVAFSVSGANQTGGTTTFAHTTTNTGANTQGSIAVTSASGNMTAASWAQTGGDSFTSTSATQIFVDNGGSAMDTGANRAAGAASVTMTAAFSDSNNNWAVIAADIVAASACKPSRTLLGVGC